MKFQAILFDLDGTLLDTLADLANSMNTVLTRLGFPAHPTEAYRYFVGEGMDNLTRNVLPKDRIDEKTVSKCLAGMREEYGKHWADNTKPYTGIPELLSGLEQRKIAAAVLSNKPDELTKIMVEKLLPDWSFRIVRGAKPTVPKKPDPTSALEIAEELQIHPRRFLYLGDTNTDMQTANSAGMYAAGVLWGFRTAEELLANGANTLIKNPQDVLKFFEDTRKSCPSDCL
ncbi:MAG: HAD family hydrolase [Phycisphaerae bacterium]|nr:HAD family hydrolase [Phycisphaerae bacterium]